MVLFVIFFVTGGHYEKKSYFRSCFQCIPVYMCSYIQIHPHGKFQHLGKGSCNTALSLNYCEQKQDNKCTT